MKLTLEEYNFLAHESQSKPQNRVITGYRVVGMPPKQEAFINNVGSHLEDGFHEAQWMIRRVVNGVSSEWQGDFKTAEEARFALETELQDELKSLPKPSSASQSS
jgi:hypothetical protein